MGEKHCLGCKQTKSFNEFYKNGAEPDGYNRRCKTCQKAYMAHYRQRTEVKEKKRQYRAAHPEPYQKEKAKKYRGRYKGRYKGKYKGRYTDVTAQAVKRWLDQDPNRKKAHRAVQRAVQKGILPAISACSCIRCGLPAKHYHHHLGYTPEHAIDVMPVCYVCHKAMHTDRQ